MKRRTTRRERVKIFRVAYIAKKTSTRSVSQHAITNPVTRIRLELVPARDVREERAARGSRRWRRAEKPPRRPASASGAPPLASRGSRRRRRDAPTLNGGGAAEDVPDAAPALFFPACRVRLRRDGRKPSRRCLDTSRRRLGLRFGLGLGFSTIAVLRTRRRRGERRRSFSTASSTRRPSRSRVRFRFRPAPIRLRNPTRLDSREHTSRERSRESPRRDSHRDSRFLQTGFSCPPICAAPRRARDARLRDAPGGATAGRNGAPRALGETPRAPRRIVQRADGALGGGGHERADRGERRAHGPGGLPVLRVVLRDGSRRRSSCWSRTCRSG